jgi:ABC-2 type transport system ATP-binding protein
VSVTVHGLDSLTPQTLLLLIPLVVVQLGLLVLAIVDLLRQDRRVRGGSKGVWAVIILFVSLLGPILYFLVGREDGPPEPQAPHPDAMPGWGSPHDPPIATRPVPPADGTSATVASPPGQDGLPGSPLAGPVAPEVPRPTVVAAGPPAIQIDGLSKRYAGGVLALDRLTMTVPEGSVFGLLGPNGAGKTTTLRLLAGLTRPTAGVATVAGIRVDGDAIEVRRRLGYLEQDPRAYGWMTGREQVRLLGRLHGQDGPELEHAVAEALDRVDLAGAADRRAATYSGGMRQRLGIAGALAHRPAIVILDEPVSSLDPEGRRDVLGLIAALRGEVTVLFSTHVLADVERICDRVGILAHGRLVVEGPLADLLDRYALPVYRIEPEPGQGATLEALAARLRAAEWVTGVSIEHGVLTAAVADPERAGRDLLPAIADAGLAVVSVARARPTLEDVFLRLTGDEPEAAA